MNKENEQQYCISARNRVTGFTEMIEGPFTEQKARSIQNTLDQWRKWHRSHKYFRVSKYPFKRHNKNEKLHSPLLKESN